MAWAGGSRTLKYTDKCPGTLFAMLKSGQSMAEFCSHVSIAKQTFFNWLDTKPEFKEAYEAGMVAAEAYWTKMGADNIENPDFNHSAHQHLLGSRFGINSRSRKMKAARIAPKDDTHVTVRLDNAINSFSDGEISIVELQGLANSFGQIADIIDKTKTVERCDRIEARLKIGDGQTE